MKTIAVNKPDIAIPFALKGEVLIETDSFCMTVSFLSLYIKIMHMKPLFCDRFPFGPRFAVIAVRVDRYSAPGGELAKYFNVLGIKKTDQVFHDNIDAILMEIAVI
jgi:hypothetical protein